MASLRQQRPRLLKIVSVVNAQFLCLLASQAARQKIHRNWRIDILNDTLGKVQPEDFPVDCISQRLPYTLVIQWRLRRIEVHGDDLSDAEDIDLDRVLAPDRLEPLRFLGSENDVERAIPQLLVAFLEVWNVVNLDPVELRGAAEVARVRGEFDAFVGNAAVENKRTGAHRMGCKAVIAKAFDGLFADDEAARIVGDLGEEKD